MLACQLKWYGHDPAQILLSKQKENPLKASIDTTLSSLVGDSTDDAAKYSQKRLSDSTYEFPNLRGKVLAIKTNGSEWLPQNRLSNIILKKGDEISLVCDQTNFFHPSGGQDTDQGLIWDTNGNALAEVVKVTKQEVQTFKEAPISVRRMALMRHHSGQHLFYAIVQSKYPSTVSQQSGGRVTPEYFTIRLSGLQTLDSPETLAEFVTTLEDDCRDHIAMATNVQVSQKQWLEVQSNDRVLRYNWVQYPSKVRVVSLLREDTPEIDGLGELCGGTHLDNLQDLKDLVVLGVRSRNSHVKEFKCAVGEEAEKIRLLGVAKFKEILAQVAQLEKNTENCAKILKFIDHNQGYSNLGFLDRYRLSKLSEEIRWEMKNKMCKAEQTPVHVVNKDKILEKLKASVNSDSPNNVELVICDYDKVKDLHKALLSLLEENISVLVHKPNSRQLHLSVPFSHCPVSLNS
ncbi:alanyl-tRNA synthetase [Cichlidogyrus casuarinus]|uniref:Alanyl-tRNA synthetase n=1 Tax=Cichlidogyrus casuarinus TaxID=1844966 RepID=A0ABD2Q7C1_9PLAT